ncbi:MAG TPA: hypothetical protein VK168_17650 [Saprospiraceae bacterium]|nr:hypothetical protein [Saprospiraceae bacterium]
MTRFFDRMDHPPVQAVATFCVALILMALGWLSTISGMMEVDRLYAWSIGAAFMLFFAMMNSLLSLKAASFVKYWGSSIYSYLGLGFGTSMLAWGFSGVTLSQAGSYRWIYIVVTVGFIVFLTLVNLMKIIVRFAEKEEWNQPRRR